MRSFEVPSADSAERSQEDTGLTPEKASSREKSVLERFRGQARKIADALIVMTAISAAPGLVEQAHAEEADGRTVAAAQQEEINKSELTRSSTWAIGIMESAHADLEKIQTAEDAEWLARAHYLRLISEFYTPTQGDVRVGSYGLPVREYSDEDLRLLLQITTEMKQLLKQLNDEYGIEAHEKRQAQLDDMTAKLRLWSTYAFKQQKEALRQGQEAARNWQNY